MSTHTAPCNDDCTGVLYDEESVDCPCPCHTRGMSTTQTQHTPGPWHVEEHSDGTTRIDIMGEHFPEAKRKVEYHITTLYVQESPDPHTGLEAVRADARLIAAAPELLAACSAALARLQPFTMMRSPDMIPEVEMLRAALAKALGQ